MLTELTLKNFKCWHNIDSMRFGPITGLFGPNSSGKTSLLQLLLMIKQTIASSDRAQILEFEGLTNLGNFKDVVFNHDVNLPLEFSLDWKLPKPLEVKDPAEKATRKTKPLFMGRSMHFRATIVQVKGEQLITNRFRYGLDDNTFTMHREETSAKKYEIEADARSFDFQRNVGRPWGLPAPVKFYGFPDQVYAYYRNAGFLAYLQLALENMFNNLYYLGPLRDFPQPYYTWKGTEPADMGRRGERVVDAMLASRQKGKYISPGPRRRKLSLEERVAYWLKELGLIDSFSVRTIDKRGSLFEVAVRQTASSANVLITGVGFGVSQVLPIIVLCYYVPEGSIILLEQPEIHLHPSVQSGLADVFIDVIQNRKVQIILESHSEHLLKRIQRRISDETITKDDASLYFCTVGKHEASLEQLQLDLFGNISNWPKDFFGDAFGEVAAMREAIIKRQINKDK